MAIAANVLQGAGTHLDHVLLTLGNLWRIYDAAPDQSVRTCVHDSLEKRWRVADQEVFILAVFFNPWIRSTAFRQQHLMKTDLARIAMRVYARVMGKETSGAHFWQACNRYYDKTGRFTDARMSLQEWKHLANDQVFLCP